MPTDQIRTISLGEEICELEYLKDLTIFSFGINALPENFIKLGKKLENLDLASNNFQSLSVVTDVVNEKNFPHLRYLTLTGCRATETLKDMSLIDGNNQYNGRDVGLHVDISQGQPEREAFLKLLTWDKLNFIANVIQLLGGRITYRRRGESGIESCR